MGVFSTCVLQFVSYTKPTLKTDAISKKRTAVDMALRLRIGRLQGTLLYKFISEIKVCLGDDVQIANYEIVSYCVIKQLF